MINLWSKWKKFEDIYDVLCFGVISFMIAESEGEFFERVSARDVWWMIPVFSNFSFEYRGNFGIRIKMLKKNK